MIAEARLCLAVCSLLRREAQAVLDQLDDPRLTLQTFPHQPTGRVPAEAELPLDPACQQTVALGCTCMPPAPSPGAQRVAVEQCLHLLLNAETIAAFQQAGYYIVSPGWLENWPGQIAAWGFDQPTARAFFAEFAQGILLLETGVVAKSAAHLEQFTAFIGLPGKTLAVGLDHFRLHVEQIVLQSRQTAQTQRDWQRTADHAMAVDLLGDMVQLTAQRDVILQTIDIFKMLYAPQVVSFVSDEAMDNALVINAPGDGFTPTAQQALHQAYTLWQPQLLPAGFVIPVGHGELRFGLLVVDGLALPERRQDYYNLAQQVAQVAAVTLSNARHYDDLRLAKQRYQTLFDQLTGAVALIDVETRRFLEFNQGALDMLGCEAAALQQWTLERLFAPTVDIPPEKLIERLVNMQGSNTVLQITRRDGAVLNVMMAGGLITVHNDPALLLTWHDISSQRRVEAAEREQERLRAELRKEQRLRQQKLQFIRTVSHEFRTPLTIIKSSAALAQIYADSGDPAQQGRHLEKITNQIAYFEKIMESIQAYNAATTTGLNAQFVRTDTAALCAEVVQTMMHAPQFAHVLTLEAPADLPQTMTDPNLLRSTLLELIDNAAKFSPPGSRIQLRLCTAEETLCLAVQDEGIGIPPADQPEIMKPFTRGANAEHIRGNGMGLAVANELAGALNGELTVTSTLGQGTTFTLCLPVHSQDSRAIPPPLL